MFQLHHLGELFYMGNRSVSGFLLSTKNIIELQKSSIVLFGGGRTTFICEQLLSAHGISPYVLCNNNVNLQNKILRNKTIESPYTCFKNKENHYIIALKPEHNNTCKMQMKAYDIDSYSIYFESPFFPYEENIHAIALSALNIIINNSLKPYVTPYLIKDEAFGIGFVKYLLDSTYFWHDTLYWLLEDFTNKTSTYNALEIGAGYGFLSIMLKLANDDFNLDWIAIEAASLNEELFFGLIRQMFPNSKYNLIYGILEDPEFIPVQKYDRIIMTEVMEHFSTNPVTTLRKVKNMLDKNGLLYLTTPDWGHMFVYDTWRDMPAYDSNSYIDKAFGFNHVYQYTENELREIFNEVGFEIRSYKKSVLNNHQFVLSNG